MANGILPAEMSFFHALMKSGSLSAAGRELGITTSAVSKRLAAIEARIGVSLVSRTTRRMGLTPEGEVLLEYARRMLSDIDELDQLLSLSRDQPKGLVRVNATLGFGRQHVAPAIARFVRQYPGVEIQLQLTAVHPPLSDDLFDVCIRFGEPSDMRVIARKLVSNRRVLCASPSYLARYGEPKEPHDLLRHNCISIRQFDDIAGVWRLTSGEGAASRTENIRVRGNLATNDGEIAVNWALEGLGILMRSKWDIDRYLQSGRLVHVLPDYETPNADIYAIYPQRLQSSARVRLFVDYLERALDRFKTAG